MEYIDGPTLAEELAARGPVAPAETVTAGIDLCGALDAVHRAGLLHRDLKAQNVMRDADGRLRLTDFGAGRDLAEGADARALDLAGTPLYLAPEVLAGQPASAGSDVYSLGVLLYHLATGLFPVTGRSLQDLRAVHERSVRTPVRAARPDLPRALARVIERAIDPDPSARYQSAPELAAALAHCRPRRRTRVAIGAAIAAVLMAGALWRVRPGPQDRLGFEPLDFALVTQFQNRTGEAVFDGALEYALERELRESNAIALVPHGASSTPST
jgi:serine/threonine-protein kinase